MGRDSAGPSGSDVVGNDDAPRRVSFGFSIVVVLVRDLSRKLYSEGPRMAAAGSIATIVYNTVDNVSSFVAHGNSKRPSGIVPEDLYR